MPAPVFRTPTQGCWRAISTPYGQYLAPARDPLADGELPAEALRSFELHENPPMIPAELWSAWIKLCFHLVRDANGVEVGCRILRHVTDHDQWRILIPEQRVTGASVRVTSTDGAIDLISGEVIPTYPPKDWVSLGSAHSHNIMESFFSSIDDSTELGDPGMHVVVGSIDINANTYTMLASITAHQKRYIIEHDKVIDSAPQTTDFHPSVLGHVDTLDLRPAALAYGNWTKKSRPTRTWSIEDQKWIDSTHGGESEWLTPDWEEINQYGRPSSWPRELGDESADLLDAHEQINDLYDKIMHIQDRKCRTIQDLGELYHQLSTLIERMDEVLEPTHSLAAP